MFHTACLGTWTAVCALNNFKEWEIIFGNNVNLKMRSQKTHTFVIL